MPNTFFTEPPHWTWFIIPYFFVGGIAGGSFVLAALLQLFGRPADRPMVRLGYYVAFVGAVVSGLLLTVDLGKPLRFWHMLFESETGRPIMKLWSPISVGAWGLLLFGLFAFVAALGALHEAGRLRWAPAAALARGPLAAVVAVAGAITGFFLAGYTGVLLSVTNRPIWADSSWIGILFLFSAGSTAAAALTLLALWQPAARFVGAHPGGGTQAASLDWLTGFDKAALTLELLALVIFLISLGSVARVFLSVWGAVLLLGVLLMGIVVPLAIGAGRLTRVRNRLVTSATLVLIGGFMLRVVVLLSSEQVRVAGSSVIRP